MSEEVSISDTKDMSHTEFQSHVPYMGLALGELTVQQEKLVLMISSGMTISAAGRAAGYKSADCLRRVEATAGATSTAVLS